METTVLSATATVKGAVTPTETEDVIIRGKRTRGPKKRPPFYPLPSTNVVSNNILSGFLYAPTGDTDVMHIQCEEDLVINPYTPLIPALYLLLGNTNANGDRDSQLARRGYAVHLSEVVDMWPAQEYAGLLKKLGSTHKHMKIDGRLVEISKKFMTSRFIGEIAFGRYRTIGEKYNVDAIKDQLQDWLSHDSWYSLSQVLLHNRSVNMYSDQVHQHFFPNTNLYSPYRRSRMRSYDCTVGLLSIFLRDRVTQTYCPSVMATILPENYMYQKYHMITKSSLDLSKVTVLVDRELDNPNYPIPAFRRLYKQRCEPILKTLNCQTLKVPVEFMKENCFVPPFKMQEKSKLKRDMERDGLIQEFYNRFSEAADVQEDASPSSLEGETIGSTVDPEYLIARGYGIAVNQYTYGGPEPGVSYVTYTTISATSF